METAFDIFGSKMEGTALDSEPPEIIIAKDKCSSSGLEIDATIDKIKELSCRSVTCLRTAKNKGKSNVEEISWSIYLLEKALLHSRSVAYELCDGDINTAISRDLCTVEIELFPDIIQIDMPILLPKRQVNLRTKYYDDAFKRALEDKIIPCRFCNEKVAMVFLHCYEETHALWSKRDHDNIDMKWIIDTLNNYFFIDDGPFQTSLYHHSTMDYRDHTLIYLVPIMELGDFLSQNIPNWESRKMGYQKC